MKKIRLKEAKLPELPESIYNFENMMLDVTYEIPFDGNIDQKRKSISSSASQYSARVKGVRKFKVKKNGKKIFITRIK